MAQVHVDDLAWGGQGLGGETKANVDAKGLPSSSDFDDLSGVGPVGRRTLGSAKILHSTGIKNPMQLLGALLLLRGDAIENRPGATSAEKAAYHAREMREFIQNHGCSDAHARGILYLALKLIDEMHFDGYGDILENLA